MVIKFSNPHVKMCGFFVENLGDNLEIDGKIKKRILYFWSLRGDFFCISEPGLRSSKSGIITN